MEIGRVLKPGGLFAAWCYGVPEVLGNPAASKLIWEFRFADDRLGPYWSQRNKLVDTQYKDIAPPADLFEEPRREKLLGQQKVTVGGLVSFRQEVFILYLLCPFSLASAAIHASNSQY